MTLAKLESLDGLAVRCENREPGSLLWEEILHTVWPEPPKGPWYWRSSKWRKWNHAENWFVFTMARKPTLDTVLWLFPEARGRMIPADYFDFAASELRRIAAALRARKDQP
jgi:hypothetical protein